MTINPNKSNIRFNFKHGIVEGVFLSVPNPEAPLVIITNGHNGFYNYGMFPYIQEQLAQNGIMSYSYNFSHGGVIGDSDYFADLEKYEKNCMRLEAEDLEEIVRNLSKSEIGPIDRRKLVFLTHSLGGAPTIFATRQLIKEGFKIDGLVLVSTIKTLNVWPPKMVEEWEEKGVYFMKNNRTKQDLPQGREFLEEIKQADGAWNIQNALKELNIRFLIIHGEKDEAVPVEHSKALQNWNEAEGHSSTLKIIPNATHTYNTKHPFEGPSPELNQLVMEVSNWINGL